MATIKTRGEWPTSLGEKTGDRSAHEQALSERQRLQVVRALLVEREAVEKTGDAGRLELIDEQLRLHGHEDAE